MYDYFKAIFDQVFHRFDVTPDPNLIYDHNGNLIEIRGENWSKWRYDDESRMTEWIDHTGKNIENKYLDNGKVLHYVDGKLAQTFPVFFRDTEGRLLRREDCNGFWMEMKYNDAGDEISFLNSDGYWRTRTYIAPGKVKTMEVPDYKITYKYDSNLRNVGWEDSKGTIYNENKYCTECGTKL